MSSLKHTCTGPLLGGSWVVISRVISPLIIWVITIVILLITLLITNHEHLSMQARFLISGLGLIDQALCRIWTPTTRRAVSSPGLAAVLETMIHY